MSELHFLVQNPRELAMQISVLEPKWFSLELILKKKNASVQMIDISMTFLRILFLSFDLEMNLLFWQAIFKKLVKNFFFCPSSGDRP